MSSEKPDWFCPGCKKFVTDPQTISYGVGVSMKCRECGSKLMELRKKV